MHEIILRELKTDHPQLDDAEIKRAIDLLPEILGAENSALRHSLFDLVDEDGQPWAGAERFDGEAERLRIVLESMLDETTDPCNPKLQKHCAAALKLALPVALRQFLARVFWTAACQRVGPDPLRPLKSP